MICLTSSLVMNGKTIKQQRYELDMLGIPKICHCASMEFPGIAIHAEREATAIMTYIYFESQLWVKSKASAAH